jgi:hypothetical protein
MSSRRRRGIINLPAPYLRRLWLEETEHFRLIREFCSDPAAFVATALRCHA